MKLSKILLPTDFSAHSYEGLRTAEILAEQAGAELLIVHVLDSARNGKHDDWPASDAARRNLEKRLSETMPARSNLSVEHTLLEGDTAEEIVRFAGQRQVDLIVMGSHGRTGIPRVLMGSVTAQVLHRAALRDAFRTTESPATWRYQGVGSSQAPRSRAASFVDLTRSEIMTQVMDRLRTLMAGDVMARRVVELSPDQSLDEAAQAFAAHKLSSAPVVDDQGVCIGVLSAGDFLKPKQQAVVDTTSQGNTVRALMTSAVQSVAPHTPLLQVAQIMSVGHIHHLPVIQNERLVGVVSTLDVVSAMVNAVDEWDAR